MQIIVPYTLNTYVSNLYQTLSLNSPLYTLYLCQISNGNIEQSGVDRAYIVIIAICTHRLYI